MQRLGGAAEACPPARQPRRGFRARIPFTGDKSLINLLHLALMTLELGRKSHRAPSPQARALRTILPATLGDTVFRAPVTSLGAGPSCFKPPQVSPDICVSQQLCPLTCSSPERRVEAIGTNYLHFDLASSLLGFGLAFWSPAPQLYGLGLLGKLKNRRQSGFLVSWCREPCGKVRL